MLFLFDLDGTLTDPMEGITRSVQFALRHFGIDEPDLRALTPYIGPPLREMFMQQHGLSEEESHEALRQYRVRFGEVGLFENRVYEGVPPLLESLRAAGHRLAVATSKPIGFSRRILEHFSLAAYFDEIVGSELDGRRTDKAEVIAEVLSRMPAPPKTVCMVGDRRFDIEGAHKCGIAAVGVRYGYAAPGELEAAGADRVVDTVEQLQKLLLCMGKDGKAI